VTLKYASDDNFVGRLIDGYDKNAKNICLLTEKAAIYLCDVHNYLGDKYNYGLLVYDAYRPRRAVLDFLKWAKQPLASQRELAQKAKHYPRLEKPELFNLHYLTEDSAHCYGNTVDVGLVTEVGGSVLGMGACFDFLDACSHTTVTEEKIGEKAFQHRHILSQAMQEFDFEPYHKEFWHFSHPLAMEVNVPIDIPITPGLTKVAI